MSVSSVRVDAGQATSRRFDRVGVEVPEVELEAGVLAQQRQPHHAVCGVRGLDGRGGAVAVPRDHLGALAGVSGREVLAQQGVQQGGLAGLHRAHQGHPERFVEAMT